MAHVFLQQRTLLRVARYKPRDIRNVGRYTVIILHTQCIIDQEQSEFNFWKNQNVFSNRSSRGMNSGEESKIIYK